MVDAFRTCIKQQAVRQLECPAHQFHLALASVIGIDDRLHGLRSQVIAILEDGLIQTCRDLEDFGKPGAQVGGYRNEVDQQRLGLR